MSPLLKMLELLACPTCQGDLIEEAREIRCLNCNIAYADEDGIPILLPADSKKRLKKTLEKWDEFYRNQPQTLEKLTDARYYVSTEDLPLIERFVKEREGKVFLELGSGRSLISEALARQGCKTVGIDFVSCILKVSKRRFAKNNLDGYFVCGDIFALPFKEGVIDFLHGGGVIEHGEGTLKAIQELYRVLKPGGIAINTVPYFSLATLYRQLWGNIPEVPILKQMALAVHIKILGGRHMKFGYEKSFTQRKIKKLFLEAGFSRVETGHFDCFLPLDFVKPKKAKEFFRKLTKYKLFWPMIYVACEK